MPRSCSPRFLPARPRNALRRGSRKAGPSSTSAATSGWRGPSSTASGTATSIPRQNCWIARAIHREPRLTFTPHLVPMTRGLLATCYADLRAGVSATQVRDAYGTAYGEEPFVRIVDSPPATKATLGSNVCLVFATVDERTRRLVAVAAIDNLVKGAAGSAIQNMNVALGFPEDAGLPTAALWP